MRRLLLDALGVREQFAELLPATPSHAPNRRLLRHLQAGARASGSPSSPSPALSRPTGAPSRRSRRGGHGLPATRLVCYRAAGKWRQDFSLVSCTPPPSRSHSGHAKRAPRSKSSRRPAASNSLATTATDRPGRAPAGKGRDRACRAPHRRPQRGRKLGGGSDATHTIQRRACISAGGPASLRRQGQLCPRAVA